MSDQLTQGPRATNWLLVVLAAAAISPSSLESAPADRTIEGTDANPAVLQRASPGIPAGSFTIRHGMPTDAAQYPALLYYVKSGLCTGTLIGERTMITARHCIVNGGRIDVPERVGSNKRVKGTCEHATEGMVPPDIALCLLDSPVIAKFERLNRDAGRPSMKETILLAGFGCSQFGKPDIGEPVFRTGLTTVVRVPDDQNSAIVARGGASLCLGDSGGAAFLELSGGRRFQVAVSSEVTAEDASFLPSVTSPDAMKSIRKWAAKHEQLICGLDPLAKGCR